MDIDKRARATAREIMHTGLGELTLLQATEAILSLVREAVAEVTPPPGHILTDDGVVRKVLGSLPLTADGCVVGDEAVVVDRWGDPHIVYSSLEEPHYSTREAAEAASKETPQ